jgi:DNA-binding NarL/FixJ family response regulator
LAGLAQGKRLWVIARELGVSHVRFYAWRLYNKLGADNKVQAVLFAKSLGLLP